SKLKASMEEEIDSLKKNKTCELVDHPAGQKLVSCKWLFKIKEGIKGVQNPRDYDVERMSKVSYANAVRSLMYLMVCMRPDIVYAVSVVSRYLMNSGKNHWEAVKRILKYLRDYTKDPNKGRSITSYAFLVHGRVANIKTKVEIATVLVSILACYEV
nr:hypothetical protein [Tanacetum cinerariifolium]